MKIDNKNITLEDFIISRNYKINIHENLKINVKRSICEWIKLYSFIKKIIVDCLDSKYYDFIEEILNLFFNNMHSLQGYSNVVNCKQLLPLIHNEEQTEKYIECERKKINFYLELGELLTHLQKLKRVFSKEFNIFVIEKHALCKKKHSQHTKRLCNYNSQYSMCRYIHKLMK